MKLFELCKHQLSFTPSICKRTIYSWIISGQKLFLIFASIGNLWGTNTKSFLLVVLFQWTNTLSSHSLLLYFSKFSSPSTPISLLRWSRLRFFSVLDSNRNLMVRKVWNLQGVAVVSNIKTSLFSKYLRLLPITFPKESSHLVKKSLCEKLMLIFNYSRIAKQSFPSLRCHSRSS